MNRLTIIILALTAITPVMAQSTTTQPGDMLTAQGKTNQELLNAWVGARAAYEASQRELVAAQGELAKLKTPPAPPGMGMPTKPSEPPAVPPSPATEVKP